MRGLRRGPPRTTLSVLWIVLGAGLLLRICAMALYTPTVFNYYGGDASRYMRLDFVGISGVFGDNAMPAGYPAFLALLRGISNWIPMTIAIQHLLGLAAAALLYAAAVRLGAPRWAALLPAVVVALSGDQIFLEHAVLTEALWMPTVALGMYCVARFVSADRGLRWLVAGGAILATAALVRNMTQVLPVVLALWAVLALPGTLSIRARHAAALLAPALLVVSTYLVVAGPVAGGYGGLSDNRGVILYGRVAQFADCAEFTPPEGTKLLCADTPPDSRAGPLFWKWEEGSPLLDKFHVDGFDPDHQAALFRFARAAIVNQPLDYARAVTKDVARFFAPGIGNARPFSGADPESMSFGSTTPYAQAQSRAELAAEFDKAYGGVGSGEASPAGRTLLGAYQTVFRVHGLLLLLLIALSIAGWAMARGATRAGASLFLVAGLTLLLWPALTWSYDARFAVLPAALLSVSAAIGLARIAARARLPERVRGKDSRPRAVA